MDSTRKIGVGHFIFLGFKCILGSRGRSNQVVVVVEKIFEIKKFNLYHHNIVLKTKKIKCPTPIFLVESIFDGFRKIWTLKIG